MSSLIYSSKHWPNCHKILVWTPSPMEKIGAGNTFSDVKDSMKRVRKTYNGYYYEPSKAYKRKIGKMARARRLPTYIQREKY